MITKDRFQNKNIAIEYFRKHSQDDYRKIKTSNLSIEKQTEKINQSINLTHKKLIDDLEFAAKLEGWTNKIRLLNELCIYYAKTVVMIERRHSIRKYNYMDFSRRMGELWENFCKLCFKYPINKDIEHYSPPSFDDVKSLIACNFEQALTVRSLPEEARKLLRYNQDQLVSVLTSGDIATELDLHFKLNDTIHNIDFKTGFNSNEKGNFNRLQMVASIYHELLPEKHKCTLFIRSTKNNNYLDRLRNSPYWEVYCGDDTYKKLAELSKFDLLTWKKENVSFLQDLNTSVQKHIVTEKLTPYIW